MYSKGLGVQKNFKEALRWYKIIAEQGDEKAQYHLAAMYYKAQGPLKNYKEALKWYKMAAEQNNVNAQYIIGNMYFKGRGVSRDLVQAHLWFHIAGLNGSKKAVKSRAKVEQKLSPAQYDEAIKIYRKWQLRN